MRDNLINLYSGRFSIHGETQIKQLIFGKLSQKGKRQTQERRSQQNIQEEGRKVGNLKPLWHPYHNQIIQNDPKGNWKLFKSNFINIFD